MLGQVCHKMFYENDETEFQEVCYPVGDYGVADMM